MNADPKLLITAAATVGTGLTLLKSLFYVKAGEKGIVFNYLTGNFNAKTYNEGFHLKMPWVTQSIIFETRNRILEETATTANKDLQQVDFQTRVLYKPDPLKLAEISKRLGVNYAEKIMTPLVKEVSKAIIAQYDAQQLLSQREQVSKDIKNTLSKRLSFFNVLVDDVAITQLSFSKEYERSIEEKQIAQQTAERMKYVVEKAKQLKKTSIIRAEQDCKTIELIGSAVRDNPAYLELKRIEAAKDISTTLSKSRNRVLLDSNMLLMNMSLKSNSANMTSKIVSGDDNQ